MLISISRVINHHFPSRCADVKKSLHIFAHDSSLCVQIQKPFATFKDLVCYYTKLEIKSVSLCHSDVQRRGMFASLHACTIIARIVKADCVWTL